MYKSGLMELEAVVAIARLGSFRAAAIDLDVSPTAIGNAVSSRWEFERHGEAMRIDVPGSLTLDEPDMIAQASRAGLGLAYVGEWMVADDITSGRLVEVLSEWTPSYPGYCLYYPGRRHMAASLRGFVDLAKEMVFRNRAAS
jgi:DNA-binding transcriptional LysR family regulator